jgi:GntR family transcriptional regulator/MocR family aminotransferase
MVQDQQLDLTSSCTLTLQGQIREMLINAILAGRLRAGDPVPSTRAMAAKLKVSRNTVAFAYQVMVTGGFLTSKDRSGYYVTDSVMQDAAAQPVRVASTTALDHTRPDWDRKIASRLAPIRTIARPIDWHRYLYPFVYGQLDLSLFPIVPWRDCVRQAMSKKWFNAWTDDLYLADDPLLIEQIRTKVLARRGIFARPEEILITLGAQNAIFLLASALLRPGSPVAMEDPGYYAARDIFAMVGARIRSVPVDRDGLDPARLGSAELVFTTPSHQFPTNATLSLERRHHLLAWAEQSDGLIIEDDYEAEIDFSGDATMPMKALDRSSRVIYVGSFSKSLMPGLRLGFTVADSSLISELRRRRGLMMRHPPSNNQRAVALFLALGHHDSYLSRMKRIYAKRWHALSTALETDLPGWKRQTKFGGSSFWLEGPLGFSASRLAQEALAVGVVVEPGKALFHDDQSNDRFFRMGFSSIAEERIRPGIQCLRNVVAAHA